MIQHARAVVLTLCVISVVGGLSEIWATSTKDKQAGRAVWLVLVVISFGVALWNWIALLSEAHPNPFENRTVNTLSCW